MRALPIKWKLSHYDLLSLSYSQCIGVGDVKSFMMTGRSNKIKHEEHAIWQAIDWLSLLGLLAKIKV